MRVITPYFSHLADWISTFSAYYDLDLESKIDNINGKTLEMSSDLTLLVMGVIKLYSSHLATLTSTL